MELKEELKPCPFCGTEPKTAINYVRCGGEELTLAYSVFCPACKITKRFVINSEGLSFKEYVEAMNNVIIMWNCRVKEND